MYSDACKFVNLEFLALCILFDDRAGFVKNPTKNQILHMNKQEKLILEEEMHQRFVDPEVQFADATHGKANANKNKFVKKLIRGQVCSYHKQLEEEIDQIE